jgi:hypothetical protein
LQSDLLDGPAKPCEPCQHRAHTVSSRGEPFYLSFSGVE